MDFSQYIHSMKDEMIKNACELIKMKSTQEEPEEGMPFGKGMDEALNFIIDLAEKSEFKTKNFDGLCGYAEYGESDTYIGIFGHVDVYGSESFAWKYGLYDAVIDDNKIYGNGALDKGSLIALFYALKAVKDSRVKLKKKVRLIVGTDEGKRYSDIKRYLREEKPPITGFTSDGYFPVVYAEKGLSAFDYTKTIQQDGEEEYLEYFHGGVAENIVPGYCCAKLVTNRKEQIVAAMKTYANEKRADLTARIVDDGVIIESFGVEYHCMVMEKGINSIVRLIDFLVSVEFGNEELRQTLKFFDEKIGFEIYGESLGIAIEDSFSGKLTFNLGLFDFKEGELHIRCDCRFPVVCDFESTTEIISNTFKAAGFRQQEYMFWNPTYMPRNHFLINTLLKAYRKVTDDNSEPVVSSCISYATEMPNVAAFGMIFPGEREVSYQANEYVDIDNMIRAAEIYAQAIYMLATEK